MLPLAQCGAGKLRSVVGNVATESIDRLMGMRLSEREAAPRRCIFRGRRAVVGEALVKAGKLGCIVLRRRARMGHTIDKECVVNLAGLETGLAPQIEILAHFVAVELERSIKVEIDLADRVRAAKLK
jgi:hypothetical protein